MIFFRMVRRVRLNKRAYPKINQCFPCFVSPDALFIDREVGIISQGSQTPSRASNQWHALATSSMGKFYNVDSFFVHNLVLSADRFRPHHPLNTAIIH